jgi:hypothetical protein
MAASACAMMAGGRGVASSSCLSLPLDVMTEESGCELSKTGSNGGPGPVFNYIPICLHSIAPKDFVAGVLAKLGEVSRRQLLGASFTQRFSGYKSLVAV